MTITERFQARLVEETEEGEFNGFPLLLRRMRAKALFQAGLMPMYFADVYRQARGALPADPRNEDQERKLTAEEFDELERFKNVMILDCCIEPKIKATPADEGDVLLADLPDELREFIYLYSQRQLNFDTSPNAADAAEKEEVTVTTLTPFLHDGTGTQESAAVDSRCPAVRPTTEPDASAGNGDVLDAAVSTGV